MRIHRPRVLATLILSLLPVGASLADGTATFSTGDPNVPTLTFSWQDVDHSRLDTPGQPAHVLAIDGKAWGVATIAGRPVSMDLDALARLLGQGNGLARLGPDTVVPEHLTALEATGRTETVAGISGEVYRVSWQDSRGGAHVDEAVLTDDPRVREMQDALLRGMTRAISRTTGMKGQGAAERELERRGLAVLRFGDDFRLESIRTGDQPDGRFALPASPIDLRQIMRGMTGG